MSHVKRGFIAEGTTCNSCAEIIRRQAMKVPGVKEASFDYASETGHVVFDDTQTDLDTILSRIEEKGYACYILEEEGRAVKEREHARMAEPAVKMAKKGFIAEGTKYTNPSAVVRMQAMQVTGVREITFDNSTWTGYVTFDENKTDLDAILYKIEEKGFKCFLLDEPKGRLSSFAGTGSSGKVLGWVFGLIGLVIAGYFLFNFVDGINLPQITPGMGYGLLFLVGLLTGFHCIAMCGGFVISYTTKDAEAGKKSHKSHLMYAAGKTLSYTIIGAAFGLLGSIVAFTPMMRGVAGVLAGIFLILFGLKMLNIFPALRKIQFKTPVFISRFVNRKSGESSNPLVIGLLNGLMIACGPLQAIYVMAAGTGSMIEGAKLLLVFALGTLPVMLGFGFLSSFISSRMTHKILKASGIVVLILGILMVNNGLALTGTGYDINSVVAGAAPLSQAGSAASGGPAGGSAVAGNGYQEIRMDVTRNGWEPNTFVLKKGVPVKWIINGKELNGCNSGIQVPKYNLQFKIQPGEQTIEFTPAESGVVSWSCWMGMIKGTFIVKDDIDLNNKAEVQSAIASAPPTPKSSGGCGCGGGGAGGSCGG